ncbi:tyrosine-type recombinase/integrase [uncultured Paraburkholderia sp.]|uniref:tyrosine-type recombinase/integrase n=1 Tax=uncultured Paraburkholderia sp. TaxID=1822466 RepID=UPI00338FBAB2
MQHGRPRSASRRVFLSAHAPITGFGPNGVGSIVRRSLQRAGIDAPTRGAHQFRHGLATQMLNHGASLGEIGEVLGHHHPQTTERRFQAEVQQGGLMFSALRLAC